MEELYSAVLFVYLSIILFFVLVDVDLFKMGVWARGECVGEELQQREDEGKPIDLWVGIDRGRVPQD